LRIKAVYLIKLYYHSELLASNGFHYISTVSQQPNLYNHT